MTAPAIAGIGRAFLAPGRIPALLIVVLLGLLRLWDPEMVEDVRLRGFDLLQRSAPRAYHEMPVRIVEIDEAALRQYGQWPWPRIRIAELVEGIAAARPLVLGLDIIFAEPDRMSPGRIPDAVPGLKQETIDDLLAQPSGEARLAAALGKLPVVMGLGPGNQPPVARGPVRTTVVREIGGDPRPRLKSYPSLIRSLPEIAAAERGRGILGGAPDRDGILRRVPMLVSSEGRLVPALSVEMMRVVSNLASIGVVSERNRVLGLTLGQTFIPTDGRARAYPYFTRSLDDRYVSAGKILDGTLDPRQLQGAIVLLGVTGLGLIDLQQTPLGLMQGVEIHAQLLENIMLDAMLRRPPWVTQAELALLALAGLLAIFALPYRRPGLAVAGGGLLLLVLLGGEAAAFRGAGLLVDTGNAALTMLAAFGVMLAAGLRAAEAARRRLAGDLEEQRQVTARLEGELNAARAIQHGLLPRRFPARPDIELYASMEPARSVGGDLYDYVQLDKNRLLFAVADVSGKGIPAALFMAMTKEVVHASAIRHGDSLNEVMTEANNKIGLASADLMADGANMMFVTCLAGILDLRTGVLVYVSAGHDAPFSIKPGNAPVQLTGDGGPPLGAVDDFPFPVERYAMAPGEILVLFTDGVTEAENPERILYGTGRLLAALAASPSASAEAAVAVVRDDLRRFVSTADQADDITLLALRWLGPQAA